MKSSSSPPIRHRGISIAAQLAAQALGPEFKDWLE
jgi:hypothetical protein